MTETQQNRICGFIRGNLLTDYQEYCPLIGVGAYEQANGKWRIEGDENIELDRSEILENAGFLIVQLGSAELDYTLDIAANALHSSLHSLFAACDEPVHLEKFRTTVEFSEYMKIYRCNFSHIVLLGHGSSNGIEFLDKKGQVAGSELGGYLGADNHHNPIQIVSLCCHSGCERMSSALSSARGVNDVIAPSETFDLRWSVHFITGFYLYRYVTGLSVDDAVEEASKNVAGLRMCVWRQGKLTGYCRGLESPNK